MIAYSSISCISCTLCVCKRHYHKLSHLVLQLPGWTSLNLPRNLQTLARRLGDCWWLTCLQPLGPNWPKSSGHLATACTHWRNFFHQKKAPFQHVELKWFQPCNFDQFWIQSHLTFREQCDGKVIRYNWIGWTAGRAPWRNTSPWNPLGSFTGIHSLGWIGP